MRLVHGQSILISQVFGRSNRIYQSQIIGFFLKIINKLLLSLSSIAGHSFVIKLFNKTSWESLFISIVIIFLAVGAGYDNQLTELSSNSPGSFLAEKIALGTNIVFALLILLLVVIYILKITKSAFRSVYLRRMDILIIIFFLVAEVSTIFTINISLSTLWLLKLARGIIIYFIFSRLFFRRKQIVYIFTIFIVSIIFEGLLAGSQFLHRGPLGIFIEIVSTKSDLKGLILTINGVPAFRAVGTFIHPNILASYIDYLLPLTLFFTFSKNKILKIFSFAAVFIGTITLFLTFSRWGTLVGFISILLALILLMKFHHLKINLKHKFTRIAFFIGVCLFVWVIFNPFLVIRFFTLLVGDTSLGARINLILQSLYMIKSFPLGIGGGGFSAFFANYDITDINLSQTFLKPVHNFYLLLLTETGFISLLVFLAICYEFITLFMKNIFLLKTENRLFAVLLFSCLSVFLIHGLWEIQAISDRLTIIFWLELGLLINILNPRSLLKYG